MRAEEAPAARANRIHFGQARDWPELVERVRAALAQSGTGAVR
jgi:hypothetical protein